MPKHIRMKYGHPIENKNSLNTYKRIAKHIIKIVYSRSLRSIDDKIRYNMGIVSGRIYFRIKAKNS